MMNSFSKEVSLRWADIDANFHLRHSVYYDLGSQHRIEILEQFGLSIKTIQEQSFGPILFREECVFKREIHLTDVITINAKILKMRADVSRWTIQHEFINAEGKVCAVLTLDGAWMDTQLRKLASPTPAIVIDAFNAFPKADDFILMEY